MYVYKKDLRIYAHIHYQWGVHMLKMFRTFVLLCLSASIILTGAAACETDKPDVIQRLHHIDQSEILYYLEYIVNCNRYKHVLRPCALLRKGSVDFKAKIADGIFVFLTNINKKFKRELNGA